MVDENFLDLTKDKCTDCRSSRNSKHDNFKELNTQMHHNQNDEQRKRPGSNQEKQYTTPRGRMICMTGFVIRNHGSQKEIESSTCRRKRTINSEFCI